MIANNDHAKVDLSITLNDSANLSGYFGAGDYSPETSPRISNMSPRECQLNRKYKKRFDTNEACNKFRRELRGSDVTHTIKNSKNPFQAVWSTQPSRRIDRAAKLKQIHLLSRSGFNKKIDDDKAKQPNKLNEIVKPVSSRVLRASTLKR